jgi:predicted esterase
MNDPHANAMIYQSGHEPAGARGALVLIHGRGATARSILPLARDLDATDFAIYAPEAIGNQWYPHRFFRPIQENEPALTSALNVVHRVIGQIIRASIPTERIVIAGFSQGACLTLEYAARHPARYGGVLGFSGALIQNGDQPRAYSGSLTGTPVFLGCADHDEHIPAERVTQSTTILTGMSAQVTEKLYPGHWHTITDDEIVHARAIVSGVAAS